MQPQHGGAAASAMLAAKAEQVAALLRLIANPRRLMLLCLLLREGEVAVGTLAGALRLSQPALSQHLALLRNGGVLQARRDGQSVFYRVADPRLVRLLLLLQEIHCPDGPG